MNALYSVPVRLFFAVAFIIFLFGSNETQAYNPNFGRNLLTNPDAETGDLSGWTILENGGRGWRVRGAGAHTGEYAFQTSFDWGRKYQVIDLIAKGFTEQELDEVHNVYISDWFSGIGYSSSQTLDFGQLKVELRDASHNVIASYDSGEFRTPEAPTPYGVNYIEYSHVFQNYGPGLRFIYFEHGGNDVENWAGHYGTLIDNASVVIGTKMIPVSNRATGLSVVLIGLFIVVIRRIL